MSHLSHHQSHLLCFLLPSFHPAFCVLHLCDSPPNSPPAHPSPRITYPPPTALGLTHPATHPRCYLPIDPYIHTHKHAHTHSYILSQSCAYTHAHATLARLRTSTRPAIYPRTKPTPQPAPVLTPSPEVLSPPHPYAPHASSIIRRRRGHGSIAILTPRRQADNDER